MQKLVRDQIPKIIEKTGRRCNVRVLDRTEYYLELKNKLGEEVNEFLADENLEELADIVEVIYELTKVIGHDIKELNAMRRKKNSEKGSFNQRLFIESTN